MVKYLYDFAKEYSNVKTEKRKFTFSVLKNEFIIYVFAKKRSSCFGRDGNS